MPTIVDMRPSTNTFRHATLIVIWLVVCLVGLGGCKSNLVKETCIDKPVWTGWEPLIVALYFIMLVGGLACVIIEGIKYMIDIKEHLS